MIVAASSRAIEHVHDRVAEHVAAELTSRPAVITATISDDPFFPVILRSSGGPELTLLTDLEAIHPFYAARVGTFEILDTTRLTELRTDWYALHESVATIRHVGPYQGIDATGKTHRVHSVVLFPVDEDGIVGELEWTSVDFARIFSGRPLVGTAGPARDDEPHIPHTRLARAQTHEALFDAWWSGRSEVVSAHVEPNAVWASKHVHGRVPVIPSCSTNDSPIVDIVASFGDLEVSRTTRLQRCSSSWFSFGEWAVDIVVDGEVTPIRTTSLLAFDGSERAVGHLAYSVDTRELSEGGPRRDVD